MASHTPTTELLEQFSDPAQSIDVSEVDLRLLLGVLAAADYEAVGGVLPFSDDELVERELENIVMVNPRERNPQLQKQKFTDYLVGPHAAIAEDGTITYHPRGRMIYSKSK